MTAVGGYLRALREGQHISRTGLAGQLEVDPATLWRIEEGKQEPSGSLLLNLIAAIRGSYEDVRRLLADHDAGEEAGRQMAELRLSQGQIAQIDAVIDEMGLDEAQILADRLMSDPAFRESIVRAVAGTRGKQNR